MRASGSAGSSYRFTNLFFQSAVFAGVANKILLRPPKLRLQFAAGAIDWALTLSVDALIAVVTPPLENPLIDKAAQFIRKHNSSGGTVVETYHWIDASANLDPGPMMPAVHQHFGVMMRLIIVAVAFPLAATPALAQFQVPGECTELAAREGFPTSTLTKYQAVKARARMALLSDRDPLVKQCRGAIRQAMAVRKAMERSPASPSSSAQ